MLSVFKTNDKQLVIETQTGYIVLIVENRYGLNNIDDNEIELQYDDVHKIYNQLGKWLGYPEMKEG